jgi:glycosidase
LIGSYARRFLALSVAAVLSACGGGGGGSTPGTPAPPPVTTPLPTVDVSSVAASDPGSTLPASWKHGAFIEIFVRSYQDSNGNGSGDIQGLISRLDYLKDLGVTGIWLMPITQSQDGDHGYAVSDYRNVQSDYGTLADMDQLLTQAHARGIGVIIDYVMNHSAAQNPIFVNSSSSAGNTYRNWYVWQDPAPSGWSVYGGNPWRTTTTGAYYAAFDATMPDWNLFNTDVVAYHQNNLRFWLNRGVDGFRFDAVGNLYENGPGAWLDQPQNYTLMAQIQAVVGSYANRYMVCEAPDDPQGFGATSACGGAFAFDLKDKILNAARGDATAAQQVADYYKTAPTGMASLLANHDSFAGSRVWNTLNGNVAQYKLAAATYLLLPGTPFIYYGEEIGMATAGSLSGDAAQRDPMSWTADAGNAGFTTGTPYRALASNLAAQNAAAEAGDPASLLNFYKALLALRNTVPALATGDYTQAGASGNVLQFQRRSGASAALVLINYGSSAATATVNLSANASLQALYPSGGTGSSANGSGQASLSVPAQSLLVFQITP